jgi:biopolymer transport protein ExbB/TolQ
VKRSTSSISVLPALLIPVCLGLVGYIGLMAAIEHHWITDPTVLRYLIGHPVSKISVAMFFVGGASLFLIGLDVVQQLRVSGQIGFERDQRGLIESPADAQFEAVLEQEHADQTPSQLASRLAKELLQFPTAWQNHYLFQRLAAILESIHRTDSTAHVEQELKYLAENDLAQQQQRYSFVQILIWATPMMGFLGTVLGISQALGGITVGPDNNFQAMMDGLKASLYVAFDTTALALTLSIILMFGQFLIDRVESQLMSIVTQRSLSELAAQFDLTKSDVADGEFESKLIATMESASERQTKLWRESMRWVGSTLSESMVHSQARLGSALETSIDNSIQRLAETVGESIERADHSMSHRWEQWQVILSENARSVSDSQTSFARDTQAVCQLLEQAARVSCQTAQQITSQFSSRAAELTQKLDMLGVLGTNPVVAEAEDNRSSRTDPPPVADGDWVSVTPAFLCEASDRAQVVLPFSPDGDRFLVSRGPASVASQSHADHRDPEVILPYMKKSA